MFRSSSHPTDTAAAVRDRVAPVVTTARERVVPVAEAARERVGPMAEAARDRVAPMATAAKVAAAPVVVSAALAAREGLSDATDSARTAVAPYAESARSAVAPYLEDSLDVVGDLLGEARHRGGGAVAALRGEAVESRLRWPFAVGFLAAGALVGAAVGVIARRMSTPVPPAYQPPADDSDPLATPPGVAAAAPQAVAPHRA